MKERTSTSAVLDAMDEETKYLTPIFGSEASDAQMPRTQMNDEPVEPRIAYETAEDQVVAGLVAQDFGIGVVPYMDMLLRLDVKILQIASPDWERSFYMISSRRGFMPPAVREFRKYVLETCQYPVGQIAIK